jgi:hypothetical protein
MADGGEELIKLIDSDATETPTRFYRLNIIDQP